MSKKKDAVNAAAFDLTTTYQYYLARLQMIGTSCFEWHNLPETIDPRFLEVNLLNEGKMIYFIDDVLGALALRVVIAGEWDVYNIPRERTAVASNTYRKHLTADDSVVIFDNYLHINMYPFLCKFASDLANIDLTINLAVKKYRTPWIVCCDESQLLTMKNVFLQANIGVPEIFAGKNMDLDSIKTLELKSPYIIDKLYQHKQSILREAFSFLGVGNLEIEKRERVNVREVQVAQESNQAERACRLKARQYAADQINKLFGYSGENEIWVEYNPLTAREAEKLMKANKGNSAEEEEFSYE